MSPHATWLKFCVGERKWHHAVIHLVVHYISTQFVSAHKGAACYFTDPRWEFLRRNWSRFAFQTICIQAAWCGIFSACGLTVHRPSHQLVVQLTVMDPCQLYIVKIWEVCSQYQYFHCSIIPQSLNAQILGKMVTPRKDCPVPLPEQTNKESQET